MHLPNYKSHLHTIANVLCPLFLSLQELRPEIDTVREGRIWEEFLYGDKGVDHTEADRLTFTWKVCYDIPKVNETINNLTETERVEAQRLLHFINNIPKLGV